MAGMGTGTIIGIVTGIGTTATGATIAGTTTAIGEVKRKGGTVPARSFFLSLFSVFSKSANKKPR
jgi:hypothetical protein